MTAARRETTEPRRPRRETQEPLGASPSGGGRGTPESLLSDTRRLVHELQVHQVELEVQNEELRRTKEEVEDGLRRYSELYDFAPMAYFTLDARGILQGANVKGAQFVGLSRSLLQNTPFARLVAADFRPTFLAFLDRALATGARQTAAVELLAAEGPPVFARLEASLLGGGEGADRRCLVAAVDVSDLRRTQEELVLARDSAQGADRAKSAFVAAMSHEIRTPLSGLIGMVRLLRSTPLDDVQRRYADLAAASSEQLLHVIDDILDFSKIEAGKLVYESVAFSPQRLVEASVSDVELAAKDKGIRLSARVDSGVPALVVGDPHRFRQVLANLLGNAVKFTGEGGVTVCAGVSGFEQGACILEVSVADTGIGIAADRRDRLFRSFSQVDDSTARTYGGTGLGLAISKELVEGMGGSIGVRSVAGEGSNFTFSIPFHLPPDGSGVEPAASPAQAAPTPRALRILVAEDEPVNREVAVAYLRERGWQVTAVANGRLAAEACASGRFDVVLMDVQMPDVDGFEATRLIRAREGGGGGRVPILGLTAHALRTDRQRCLDAGMDDHLPKPVDPDVLYAAVERWAGSRAVR